MTVTITTNTPIPDVMHPLMRLGIEYQVESRNVVHKLIEGHLLAPPIAITLRDSSTPRGTLRLLFEDEAQALEAEDWHRRAYTFGYADTEHPAQNMTYVVDGKVSVALDPQTRLRWVVSVDFQALGPTLVPL